MEPRVDIDPSGPPRGPPPLIRVRGTDAEAVAVTEGLIGSESSRADQSGCFSPQLFVLFGGSVRSTADARNVAGDRATLAPSAAAGIAPVA
jgi:hypothetical protein